MNNLFKQVVKKVKNTISGSSSRCSHPSREGSQGGASSHDIEMQLSGSRDEHGEASAHLSGATKDMPSDGQSYEGQHYGAYGQMPPSSENYYGEHEQVPPSEDPKVEDALPARVMDETGLWFMPQEYQVYTTLQTRTFEHTKVFNRDLLTKKPNKEAPMVSHM